MRSPQYNTHKHAGVVLDLPPEEVEAEKWTSVSNFQFQEQASIRVGGYEPFAGAPLFAPIFAINVLDGPTSWWIYCGVSQVGVTDGTNHFDITPVAPLSVVPVGAWTGTILNGVPVLSNGINAPIYWDRVPANKCVTIPGWPANAFCKAIRAFKFHLFALNVFDGTGALPNTIWWSAAAAPGNIPGQWTPTPANDAGDADLGDTPGIIIDGLALRDQLIVYKEFSTYTVSYVGGQYTYANRKLFLTSGLQSVNSIAEINGQHWVFTGNDLIVHDGQSFQSIIQDKVKQTLVSSIDPSKITWSTVTARHKNNQIWLSFATQGQTYLNRAMVVNVITGDVGLRELPLVAFVARGVAVQFTDISWDSDSASWDSDVTSWDQQSYSPTEDSLLMVDQNDARLWSVDTSDSNNGQPVYAYLERQSMASNDNIMRALVTRIVPRMDGEPGEVIDIRVGSQAFFSDPISWSAPVPFTIGQSAAAAFQVEGRLLSVRFEATTMRRWKVYSYRMAVVDLGLY